MSRTVEIDDHGVIQLPDDVRALVKPGTRFTIEIHRAALIFHPEGESLAQTATSPQERAEAVRRWASLDRPVGPVLADAALRREQMYD